MNFDLDLETVEWVFGVYDDIVKQLKSKGFARVRLVDLGGRHIELSKRVEEWFNSSKSSLTQTEPGYGGMRSVGYASQSCRKEFEVRLKNDEKKVAPSSGNLSFDRALIEAYQMYSRAFRHIVRRIEIDLKLNKNTLTSLVKRSEDAPSTLHSIRMCKYLKCGESTVCPTHTDVGFLTLIPYASVPGLECQTLDGEWVKVEETRDENSDAVLIVGNTMEFVTGIPATPHRVVHTDGTRTSVSFHTYARPDAKIESLKGGGESEKEQPIIFVRDLYDRKRTKNRVIKNVLPKSSKNNSDCVDVSVLLKKFLVL